MERETGEVEKWVRWIQGGNWLAVETVEGLGGLIGGERRGGSSWVSGSCTKEGERDWC